MSFFISLKCFSYQFIQLIGMSGSKSSCCSSSYWSSCIVYVVSLLKELSDISKSWLSIIPNSCIFRFFLSPCNFSIFELFHFCDNFFEWERTKTLNSKNSNIILVFFCSSSFKIIINLTSTQNHLSNLFRSYQVWIFVI